MRIEISNIDQTTDSDGVATISISYERDGKSLCAACPKTTDVAEATAQFITGNITDAEFIAAVIGIGGAEACARALEHVMRRISPHIAFDGHHVSYAYDDGRHAPVDEVLEDHLVRLIKAGADEAQVEHWAAFAERLYGSTSLRNRTYLLGWLRDQGWLDVDEKGRLVGYHGCGFDTEAGRPVSARPALAIVDGARMAGDVPLAPKTVVEEPRPSTYRTAATPPDMRLTLGTHLFAKMSTPRGGVVAKVAVAPEDVVGSPGIRKAASYVRCKRLEVIDWSWPDDDTDAHDGPSDTPTGRTHDDS